MSTDDVFEVEIAPGVKVDTSMSSQERWEAHKAAFAKAEHTDVEATGPPGPVFAHSTRGAMLFEAEQRAANATGMAKTLDATVSKPAAPTADNVATFDAEMRAKGLQHESAPAASPGGPNEAYAAAVLAKYTEQRQMLDAKLQHVPQARTKIERDIRELQQRFLKEYAYAQEGGTHPKYPAVAAPATPAPAPAVTPDVQAALDAVKFVPGKGATSESIGAALRSGYEIPPGIHWDAPELIAGLKEARAIGMTQAQVTAYLTRLIK